MKKLFLLFLLFVSVSSYSQEDSINKPHKVLTNLNAIFPECVQVQDTILGNKCLIVDGEVLAFTNDSSYFIVLDSVDFGAGNVPFTGSMYQSGDTTVSIGTIAIETLYHGIGFLNVNAGVGYIVHLNGNGLNLDDIFSGAFPVIKSNSFDLIGFIDYGIDSSELNLAVGTVVTPNYSNDATRNVDIGIRNYFFKPTGASDNVYIGYLAGDSAKANGNIGIGTNALRIDDTGENVAIGANSQPNNKGGGNMTVGNFSMVDCISCDDNSILGFAPIEHFQSNRSVAIGSATLRGSEGTAIVLESVIAIGFEAAKNGLGDRAIAIGNEAAESDSTTDDLLWIGTGDDPILRGAGGSIDTLHHYGKFVPAALQIRGLGDAGDLLSLDASGNVEAVSVSTISPWIGDGTNVYLSDTTDIVIIGSTDGTSNDMQLMLSGGLISMYDADISELNFSVSPDGINYYSTTTGATLDFNGSLFQVYTADSMRIMCTKIRLGSSPGTTNILPYYSVDPQIIGSLVEPWDSVITTTIIADNVRSGTYTPTLSNTTNVAASTARLCTYQRTNNMVMIVGQFDIDPTLTGATVLGISLPPGVTSNFTTVYEAGGDAVATGIAGMSGGIQANATTDVLEVRYIAVDVTNQTMTFTAGYEIK